MTNKTYEPLIELLRSEIEAYGKLFNLLEDQRSALIQQDVDRIVALNLEVETHSLEIKRLNRERRKMVRTLHPAGENRIVSFVDEQVQDASKELFKELIREINRLIRESQRQLSTNQMLYRRALEVSQGTMRILRPDLVNSPGTYRRDGLTNVRQRNAAAAYIARTA